MAVSDETLHALVEGNPGQGTFVEYRYLCDAISERAPCKLLVFGVGKDSALWLESNQGGKTEFVEHEAEWIAETRRRLPGVTVHQVHYETQRKQWKKLMERRDVLFMQDLPDDVLAEHWDLIFVDSPQGGHDKRPGRMKSIYTASVLAYRSPGVDVLLHDAEREVERAYGDRYLGAENLVHEVERIRHYRPR